MAEQRSDRDLLIEIHTDVRHLKATVADIPSKCAHHSERLKAVEDRVSGHDDDIESLWCRWWWAVGIAITTLVGVVSLLLKPMVQ